MIIIHGATKDLLRKVLVLKDRYPNDVSIEKYSDCLDRIIIYNGVPTILKHYGFDNQLRIEIGSYLSDVISNTEYISIEIS